MADAARLAGMTLTYEDYLSFPGDGRRYEILEGELHMTPAPSTRHQDVSRNLEFIIFSHIKERRLGKIYDAPIDVIFSDTTIVQPDLLFVSTERLSLISDRGIDGAPDLIVEILSPATQRFDRMSKLKIYAQHGVQWYWIVNPAEETVEEFLLAEHGYALQQSVSGASVFMPGLFPGLAVHLADVWP